MSKLSNEERARIREELRKRYESPYPPISADTLHLYVPLDAYTQAIQSLKSLRQHIESIPFADAVKMMEDSEAAGVVINESAKYLPNE